MSACPACSSFDSTVKDSRRTGAEQTRRRGCNNCGHKWNTAEVTAVELKQLRRIKAKAPAPLFTPADRHTVREALAIIERMTK